MSNPLNVKCPRTLCMGTWLHHCTKIVNYRTEYDTDGNPVGGTIGFVNVEFHSERVALAELVNT